MSGGLALPRAKLAAVLGMLGSEHDGEVLNAARTASRMVQAAGLTWRDVIAPVDPTPAQPPAWRKIVVHCLRDHARRLSTWEWQVLVNLDGGRRISAKQLEVLEQIAARLARRR